MKIKAIYAGRRAREILKDYTAFKYYIKGDGVRIAGESPVRRPVASTADGQLNRTFFPGR